MMMSLKILQHYKEEGEEFLDCIMMGSETWVHYWIPETK